MEPIKNITSTVNAMESHVKLSQKVAPARFSRLVIDHRPTGDSPNEETSDVPGKDQIDYAKLTEDMNKYVRSRGTKISFKYDERVSRPVIVVRDQETGEVIRQIPPEEMLKLLDKLRNINGILFQGKG